jgi:hypothetical protein
MLLRGVGEPELGDDGAMVAELKLSIDAAIVFELRLVN